MYHKIFKLFRDNYDKIGVKFNFFLHLFLDINECTTGIDNCHAFANCFNNIGSFSCACKNGYIGNGTFCQGKGKNMYNAFFNAMKYLHVLRFIRWMVFSK